MSRRALSPAPLWPGLVVVAGLAFAGCAWLQRLGESPQPPPPASSPPPSEQGWTSPRPVVDPGDETTPPPPATLAVAARTRTGEVPDEDKPDWMRGLKLPDLPLRWYPKTTRYLYLYRSEPRYREIMRGWLRRMEGYRALMEAVLAREGLPRGLIFVAMIESGFSSSALSNRGAGGFWQFTPAVARGYGLEVSFWVDERRDFERSTAAAAIYLGDLYHRFGTWELALAGYNAGFHAVLTSVLRYNTNDFWTLSQLEAGLPWETTEYVPKILAVGVVERNRKVFGFDDVVAEPPRTWVEVEIAAGVPFDLIASRAGLTVEELSLMNPAYLRKRTPPDRGATMIRVPPGRAAGLNTLRMGDLVQVRVRPGETFARIAKDRKVPRDRLRRINGVTDESEVTPGTVILLPRGAGRPGRPAPGRS